MEEQVTAAASEQADNTVQEQQQEEQKMVPLAALEAERRKRQEAEARASYQENILREQQMQATQKPKDPDELVTLGTLEQDKAITRREIMEQVYQDMNPEAVQRINTHLKTILEKKPWLADSLNAAPNRYARANEIVMDYMHLVETPKARSSGPTDGQRIVQNAQKPGSPIALGKSANPSGADYLKSIQGTKEFRDYRQKVRGER